MRIKGDARRRMGENRRNTVIDWEQLIPKEDWEEYEPILRQAEEQKIKFAVGGGLAFSEYAGRLRNTKDIDLLILPRHRDQMVEVLSALGWDDYYDEAPYDRSWIYRGHKANLICDI